MTTPSEDLQIKQIALATHRTEAEVRAQLELQQANSSLRQYIPFGQPGNAEEGILWLGQQPEKWDIHPGLPPIRPTNIPDADWIIKWGGKSIRIMAPNFGPEMHTIINTSIGENPSTEDMRKAREEHRLRIWVELRDKDNKPVYMTSIDENQTQALIGDTAEVRKAKQSRSNEKERIDAENAMQRSREVYGVVSGTAKPAPEQQYSSRDDQREMRRRTAKGHRGAAAPPEAAPTKKEGEADVTVTMDPYAGPQGEVMGLKQVDKTGTIKDELASLYNLEPDRLKEYKHKLWLAGYYGHVPLEAVNMSVLTNDDITAFAQIMTSAANYYAAHKNVRWQDLLTLEAQDPASAARRVTSTPPIETHDPAAITKAANETATAVLGRGPSPEDVRALIKLIQNKDIVAGKAHQVNTGQTVVNPDPQADVEQFYREHYPNEAMAVDWGAGAQLWEKLLRDTSPQPRVGP